MRNSVILVLVALAAVAAYFAYEQSALRVVTGPATVIDGDSLEIGSTTIRLFGVDAPEGRQPCYRNGDAWRCGEAAAEKLRDLVARRTLECRERDVDGYGRSVAVCTNGEADVGAELVRAGLALAYRQFSDDYVDEEAEARSAQRGLWAGEFTPPWQWRGSSQDDRARHNPDRGSSGPPPRAAERRSADSCFVKGNISQSTGERIYHLPGWPNYDGTVIDESRGERWFCSADEAEAAGWRAPRNQRRN